MSPSQHHLADSSTFEHYFMPEKLTTTSTTTYSQFWLWSYDRTVGWKWAYY